MTQKLLGELITPDKAAQDLQISSETIRRWLRSGAVEGYKVGKQWRVDLADLKTYLTGQEPDQVDSDPELKLYQFYFNNFGVDCIHLVAAYSTSEAIRTFTSQAHYRGVHADDLVASRNIENHTVIVTEQGPNGQQLTVDWQVSEIELKPGVLV